MYSDFLKYICRARNHHGIHSPFVYELYNDIVRDSSKPDCHAAVEAVRKELKKDHSTINITDFGSGSLINSSRSRKISDIVRSASKSPRWGRLLYKLIRRFGYRNIIDLGTSFGLTTAYEAMAASEGTVTSFEGCPETASVARCNFEQLGISNVHLVTGNIDETLPALLAETGGVDMVFFDANHRYEPTMRYFRWCLANKHENSCFVFDDIYLTAGMKKAWQEIKDHEEVSVTLDFFFVGVVFFRSRQAKEHFTLRSGSWI